MASVASSKGIPVDSLPNVNLQWYINYDYLLETYGLNIDRKKYNSQNGTTLANVVDYLTKNWGTVGDNICPNTVLTMDLYSDSFKHKKFVVVCRNMVTNTDKDEMLGIALISFNKGAVPKIVNGPRHPDYMVVDLLCGHKKYSGVGRKIMDALKEFCANHDIDEIVLESLDTSKRFYETQGFTVKNKDMMSFYLKPPPTTLGGKRKTRKDNKSRKSTKRIRPTKYIRK